MKELQLYGQIGREITDSEFISQINELNNQDFTLRVNSPGGAVFSGYAIYNALKEYKGLITVIIDGVAASMASVICLAGSKVYMANNAMYMIHNPSSDFYGDSKKLKSQIDLLDKMTNIMIETYTAKSGLSENEIRQMMDNETWLDANEALKLGFIDEIKGQVLSKQPTNENLTIDTVYACYSKLNIMNKELNKLLSIDENSSEKDTVQAVKQLLDEFQKMKKNRDSDISKEAIDAVLNQAVRDKKFVATMIPSFRKLLQDDFAGTVAMINEIPSITKPLSAIIGQNTTTTQGNDEKPKAQWNLEDYRKFAPKELQQNPQLYNNLLEAENLKDND